jgi:23S rRNA (uracil1939-C5)-methyltransferase
LSVELIVDTFSDDLRGLVRHHGKVGFVAGALPGETVRVEHARRHRRYDDYRLLDVCDAAAERVVPPCPLVGRCGGCDLQHVAAAAQLQHKAASVLAQLERVAGLRPAALEDPIVSRPFGYRRRARLAFYVPRLGAPRLGFRELAGRQVIDVERCPVLAAELAELPGPLAVVLKTLRRPGAVGHVELSVSEATDGEAAPVIHVHLVSMIEPVDLDALAAFAAGRRAYMSVGTADGNLIYVAEPGLERPGYLLPDFRVRIEYRPGDFLQGNAVVNRQLVARVVQWLTEAEDARILEGFAGIGNFSLPLARRGLQVLALEGTAAMVERARSNADSNGVAVEFRVLDLMKPDRQLMAGFRTVLLDPPRAGAAAFVQAAAESAVETVLYVSCAAPTLARDAALLARSGFGLSRLALVDMLPQTRHIECMALFRRSRSGDRSFNKRVGVSAPNGSGSR